MRSIGILLSLWAGALSAQSCNFEPVETRFQQLLTSTSLSGGALLVASPRGVLQERYFGNFTAATKVPIASASKLISGVRLLQLKDRGVVDLDAPLSTYLPQFTGLKGTMTLRQMFSHTAGYGNDSGDPVVFNRNITLAQAVNTIAANYPLQNGWVPGGQFAYGGVSMHIGGRIAEVQGNADWQAGWQSEIGVPLGISTIDWQGLGVTQNYGIAGSAQSNLRDYVRVLEMLANRGVGNGARVLSAARVTDLMQDGVGDLPIAYSPGNAPEPIRYGFGGWLVFPSGAGLPLMHSLGALGYFPWIDFQRNVYGVFMIRGTAGINSAALPAYTQMLESILSAVDGGDCRETELFDRVFADRF
jgi:CubicO group peptidase (beta-lactamase class C family)